VVTPSHSDIGGQLRSSTRKRGTRSETKLETNFLAPILAQFALDLAGFESAQLEEKVPPSWASPTATSGLMCVLDGTRTGLWAHRHHPGQFLPIDD
jgi:hypothetical protein